VLARQIGGLRGALVQHGGLRQLARMLHFSSNTKGLAFSAGQFIPEHTRSSARTNRAPDGMPSPVVMADEDGRRIMGACPSQRTTLLELIQAFVSYARSHELPDNAALAVTRALQEAFPCQAHQGFRGQGGVATLIAMVSIHAQFAEALRGRLLQMTAKSGGSRRGTALKAIGGRADPVANFLGARTIV
jgi:hypothetical protein